MLHDEGYQFNESGVITDLTQTEIDLLTLGRIVKGEETERQQNENPDSPSSRRRYSKPKQSLDEAMENYSEKHELGYQ